MGNRHSGRRGLGVGPTAVIAATLLLAACTSEADDAPAAGPPSLESTLADAFRIDISELEVTYDYWPKTDRVEGSAELRFAMRADQKRPLFHLNPVRGSGTSEQDLVQSIELDGERLDPGSDDDVRRIRTSKPAEHAFEIQRDVEPADAHTLHITWSIPAGKAPGPDGWFFTDFDDTEGPDDETETLWPTVSSPEEFARHRLHLRVHSERPYTVTGSGVVHRRDGSSAQEWEIDTARPVASHTVFFAAVPSKQVRTREFDAQGVETTIVSNRSPAKINRAEKVTRRTIKRLEKDFGPFPMPTMNILLTGWGSGMEYYGATRTGIGSLEHELGHMYFGAATVNRTWRDTWLDEAAVVWWEEHAHHELPLRKKFSSNIAGGRSAVEPGFNTRAYGAGAKVLAEVARALGGDRQMLEFLSDLHQSRAFEPYTTDDFIDDVVAAQDEIDRTDLERWLLTRR